MLALEACKISAIVCKNNLVTCHSDPIGMNARMDGDHGRAVILFFNQLQQDHLSSIAQAWAQLEDPGVSTVAVGKTGGNIVEQLLDDLGINPTQAGRQPGGGH